MKTIVNVLRQILTGKDGTTHDIARWGAALSMLVFLGLESYQVVALGKDFQMREFGEGVGLVFSGAGIFIKAKENTEPDPVDPTPKQ